MTPEAGPSLTKGNTMAADFREREQERQDTIAKNKAIFDQLFGGGNSLPLVANTAPTVKSKSTPKSKPVPKKKTKAPTQEPTCTTRSQAETVTAARSIDAPYKITPSASDDKQEPGKDSNKVLF
jgi:hypothetical protein